MTDRLHQININYHAVEDRLLLRINTRLGNEFRIWLTRRCTQRLLDVLQKAIDRLGGMPAVASRPETTRMFRQGALEKPYEEERVQQFPLGQEGFVACRVKAARAADDNLALELLPEQGQGVTMNLNQSLLFMFYNLLSQGIGRADWSLSLAGEEKVH